MSFNTSLLFLFIITARKRSLGQGNIFAPVCHSVHGGGVWSRGVCLLWGEGGACSQGGHLVPGGGCLLWGSLVETPRRLLLRAVRILLGCILVSTKYSNKSSSGGNRAYFQILDSNCVSAHSIQLDSLILDTEP